MEFRSRTNSSQASGPAPSAQSNQADRAPAASARPDTSSTKRKLILIGVVLVAALLLLVGGYYAKKALFSSEGAIQRDKYQAVFLTNGQVYFAKLSDVDNPYVKLSDIYYLQVQQTVQPEQSQEGENNQQQPQVSLTKLGSELHGPQDVMHVSRDQVLFWENLKDDGKVAQAIKEHKNKK